MKMGNVSEAKIRLSQLLDLAASGEEVIIARAGRPWGENVAEYWLFGISPEGIGVIGMLLNFTVAITVSYLTAPPPEHIQHMVEHIRIPRSIDI